MNLPIIYYINTHLYTSTLGFANKLAVLPFIKKKKKIAKLVPFETQVHKKPQLQYFIFTKNSFI